MHPNMLNDAYWAREFADDPHYIGSLPHSRDLLADWAPRHCQLQDSLQGDQLIYIARF